MTFVLVLAGLGAAVAAALVVRRVRGYRRLFSFDPRADQPVGFAVGGADGCREFAVSVDGAGFDWPAGVPADGGAVVLELRVAASWLGRLADPRVEVVGPAGTHRHYLERGARGTRLLLLGAAPDVAPGARVTLRGRRVRWAAGRARLWVAPRLDVARGPTLVVAPHSDDAELAAFGLYGPDCWIVTVTAGERGTFPLPGHARADRDEAWARARLRAHESAHVPGFGGVDAARVVLLGYFDGTLASMFATPDAAVASERLGTGDLALTRGLHTSPATPPPPASASWRGLVADLAAVLAHVRPARVVLPHPVLDLHVDHRFATLAVLDALHAGGDRAVDVLFYANHRWGASGGRNPQPVGTADGRAPLPWHGPVESPLYAYPVSIDLDPRRQGAKQIALESLIDLRPPAHLGPLTARRLLRSVLGPPFRALCDYDLSFYRRNARPNEVFFAVPASRVAECATRLRALVTRS